ncbi:MAG: DUF4214 domain-containing protein [Pseudomonadota bacterium]
MANIKLTNGNDTFTQSADSNDYNTYFAEDGDDIIRIYIGDVHGGAGNDIIERLPSADWWRAVSASYWDSPAAVTADLEAGYAFDGWGGKDTLIGVQHLSGSWFGNKLYGNSDANNLFIGGGGANVVDGRGGIDTVYLPNPTGKLTMADFRVDVSVDGVTATISSSHSQLTAFSLVTSNVEQIGIYYGSTYPIADYISPVAMATALIAGGTQRWNAGTSMGTAIEIPFNFITAAPTSGVGAGGFQAFTIAQQATVRSILNSISAVSGISFRETTDPNGKGLHFGASQQSNTKGLGSMPGETNAGQVWMDIESLVNLEVGSEGYAALLHEIAHALGLRHPRNVEAGDAYTIQWRVEDDATARTVLSQNLSIDGMFPSMLGAYDIAALRQIYGSKPVNSGDTVYALSGLTSQTTIVDDGGIDTISASKAATGVTLNLVPGRLSSIGVSSTGLSAVENLGIEVSSKIENGIGSAHDDYILGNELDNQLTGGSGNDWLEGGKGNDTAVFSGARDDYMISTGFGKWFVTARDGVSGFDTLVGIEKIAFADSALSLAQGSFGSDADVSVDQNASVSGVLPASSDGAAVNYAVVSQPSHGKLILDANGSYSYTPNTGMMGSDFFSFTLKDAGGVTNTYRGFISVRKIVATTAGSADGETLTSTSGHDLIDAGAGNDIIMGSAGSDGIDGGSGIDMVQYSGNRSGFALSMAGTTLAISKAGGGFDYLADIERVKFADVALAFDLNGSGGAAYRVYQAAFDRTPDKGGLGFWMAQMDRGTSQVEVARGFMQSKEFKDLYGENPTAEQFVGKLYNNVLHRAPEKAGYDFWVSVVASGYDRAEVLAAFAESGENFAQLLGVMSAGMAYDPFGG